MTEIFAVQSFVALFINSALGIYVIRKNPGAPANRSFALLMLTFVIWDLSEGVLRLSSNVGDMGFIRLWVNIEWVGIAAISGALLHFILSYPRKRDVLNRWYAYPLIYGPPLAIILLIWTTDIVVSGAAMGWMGYDAKIDPAGYVIPAVVYAVQIFLALAILLRAYTRSVGIVRSRSKILLMGIAVPVVVGSVTEVFLPFFMDVQTRLGAGTIYTVVMGLFTAYAITKYKLLVIEPTVEEVRLGEAAYKLELDHNYLLKGESSVPAYRAFRNMVTRTPGLCITTTYPEKVQKRFGMERTPIIWLSKVSSEERTLKPSDLDFEVTQTIIKFVKENPETSVFMDDLEYLSTIIGFQEVSKFVKRISDVLATENSTLVVPLNPRAFSAKELAIFEKNFDFIREMRRPRAEEVDYATSNTVLSLSDRSAHYERFARTNAPKLHIGTTHPRRIDRQHVLGACEYIWLTETRRERDGLDPSQLNYEVLRRLSKFIEESPGSAILLEGIEYLISHNGFSDVLSFMQSAIDLVSISNSRLYVPLDPAALGDKQLAILEKRFDTVA
ncbi:MAG: DUF835 domain-containing protein [Thermoplasmata archaeon]